MLLFLFVTSMMLFCPSYGHKSSDEANAIRSGVLTDSLRSICDACSYTKAWQDVKTRYWCMMCYALCNRGRTGPSNPTPWERANNLGSKASHVHGSQPYKDPLDGSGEKTLYGGDTRKGYNKVKYAARSQSRHRRNQRRFALHNKQKKVQVFRNRFEKPQKQYWNTEASTNQMYVDDSSSEKQPINEQNSREQLQWI